MKLMALFLFAAVLQVSANGYGQTVTYRAKAEPITSVFAAIKQQTDYSFVFSKSDLKNIGPVTVDFHQTDLTQALQILLRDQPLEFRIAEQTIFINKKTVALPITAAPPVVAPPVRGIVRGPDGQPLEGISVTVKGTTKGTFTDANGQFSLDLQAGQTLILTGVGYERKEFVFAGSAIHIELATAETKLDEVVMTAYSKTSNRLSTGNITTITSKDIEKSPAGNPLLTLQGRVPGLNIVSTGGNANSAVNVNIQGLNSLNNTSDPFYVIDGVPYLSRTPLLSNFLPPSNAGGNPLFFINPSDIESISVLRDAEATAIYGSRAASGAILITTKKGKKGDLKIDANFQYGFSQQYRRLKMMNATQYLQMRREAIQNEGRTIGDYDYDLNGTWDTTRSVDWQKELFGGSPTFMNANATVSGGTEFSNSMFSMNYNRTSTVYPGSFGDENFAMSLGQNFASANKRFQLQFKGSYLIDNNFLPFADLPGLGYQLAPVSPAPFNADGTFNWALDKNGVPSWYNPYARMRSTTKVRTGNLMSNLVLSYDVYKGLTLKSLFGYNEMRTDGISKDPLSSARPDMLPFFEQVASYNNSRYRSFIVEPQLNYQTATKFGDYSVVIGGSVQQNLNQSHSVIGLGHLTEALLDDPGSSRRLINQPTAYNLYKYAGMFAILNYNYKNKYLVNLSGRRDGSSRFGPRNKFNTLGAVSAGWAFTEEKFMRGILPVLSFGKLRASYGLTGSDQISDYSFLTLFSNGNVDVPYGGGLSLRGGGLTNPYLQWEVNRKLNIGLDLGFLKNTIMVNVNYFRNRASNQLGVTSLPSFVGGAGVADNIDAVIRNTGLELALTSQNIKQRDFTWSTNFNITIPRNKLLRLGAPDFEGRVGHSLTTVKTYKYAGVNSTTGDYQFYTQDGHITSQPDWFNDRFVYVDKAQRLYGGLENTFSYKNLQLSFLITFVQQKSESLGGSASGFLPGTPFANMTTELLDHWTKPGDQAKYQRFTTGSNDWQFYLYRNSDGTLIDASNATLRNVAISYKMPGKVTRFLHSSSAQVYVQGQNLYTLSAYKGINADGLTVGTIGPMRTIIIGLRASF